MERTITVKGVGSISAKPDFIVLTLSIEEKDKSYEKAMGEASRKIDLLESAVQCIGFEKGALKTISFNVSTQYESVKDRDGAYQRVFTGYRCFHRLKLSFDFDSKRLATVLTTIASSSASPELSISFTVKDPVKVSEELLASAADNARKKAEILSRAAGVNLGQLLRIDYNWEELNITSPTRYVFEDCMKSMMAKNSHAPEIEPDDIDLHDTAAFIWEIE